MVQRGEEINPPMCDEFLKINSLQPGQFIEGIYLGFFENTGEYGKQKVHRIFTPQKKIIGVNGTSAINQRLEDLNDRPYVFITYIETKEFYVTLSNGTQEKRNNVKIKVELGMEDNDTRQLRSEAPDDSAKAAITQLDVFANVPETPF